MSDKDDKYGVDDTGEFEEFVAQRQLINKIKDSKDIIAKNEKIPEKDRVEYFFTLDAIANKVLKFSRLDIDRELIREYSGRVERLVEQAEGKAVKIGGLVGLIIHHKIITLVLLAMLIIFFVLYHK
jgi:hypothetical protein